MIVFATSVFVDQIASHINTNTQAEIMWNCTGTAVILHTHSASFISFHTPWIQTVELIVIIHYNC